MIHSLIPYFFLKKEISISGEASRFIFCVCVCVKYILEIYLLFCFVVQIGAENLQNPHLGCVRLLVGWNPCLWHV